MMMCSFIVNSFIGTYYIDVQESEIQATFVNVQFIVTEPNELHMMLHSYSYNLVAVLYNRLCSWSIINISTYKNVLQICVFYM